MAKRTPQPDEIDLHGLRHKPALELVRETLAKRENQQGSQEIQPCYKSVSLLKF